MDNKNDSFLDDAMKVAFMQRSQLNNVDKKSSQTSEKIDARVKMSEDLLRSLGVKLPDQPSESSISQGTLHSTIPDSWETLVEKANSSVPESISFNQLLSDLEINTVLVQHQKIENDLKWVNSLDRFDVTLAVLAGSLAGMIDCFLVQVPKHPSFLGSESSEGGWLSNFVKDKFSGALPPEKIKELEKAYKVSYDPSTSRNLEFRIEGLGPRTHRYQSLGHDPILGFIFGVRDILFGEFTAIDKYGRYIRQSVGEPAMQGMFLFESLSNAFKTQFGHLCSDVATPSGLPAPLMPLLMFLQKGDVGNNGYTIGELSRAMYRSGYDFRHFTASSIPVLITDVIIRFGYMIKKIYQGNSLKDSLPLGSSLTLRRQLLIAHGTASAINTGKYLVTQNPLSLSWAQTLATLKYVLPEVSFQLYGKEKMRKQKVNELTVHRYDDLQATIKKLKEEV